MSDTRTLKMFPNCKINLGLRVVRKREDGYHDLETIFYPIYGLHDELEVSTSSSSDCIEMETEGISLDCRQDDNLVVKCYRMMAEKYPRVGHVKVSMKKCIPFGAGLGGGSSDAAFMAKALNELFDLGLSKEEMAKDVAKLGADCAFFIYNVPCYATGIGDRLKEIDLNLSGKRLVMIKPDVYVSTKEAYAGIIPSGEGKAPNGGNMQDWVNDFEKTVFAVHPELGEIKQTLSDAGAEYAAMSGSGSTLFGLFENHAESGSDSKFGLIDEKLASMVIFNDTLA
ncbi:MAG: 4-(cytidine 5'-diphospho)-2-C-methyl-D-erythritol kinase [Paludibacteraceae bacterium]|nr:4-(cytidine 5'-diphospho)-2-C-methyl-D-erythritol kinase [Paludibacteraceae bacterium]